MTEVLFYHLTQHSLQQALPGLLERCVERDWRVTVQVPNVALRNELNDHLWTFRDDSFLPHGAEEEKEPNEAEQPIWLTTGTDNPNGANVRFVVGISVPVGTETYERMIYMFDGDDDEAVAAARERWKIEKSAGHDLTYWQQNEEGRWQKSA